MATEVSGLKGVLGDFLSPGRASKPKARQKPSAPSASREGSQPARPELPKGENAAIPARTGRPPGKRPKNQRVRSKTSIWVTADVMSRYRDWSWEERCHLGELIERALVDYEKRNRQTVAGAKAEPTTRLKAPKAPKNNSAQDIS
jgi:hypothetical protein